MKFHVGDKVKLRDTQFRGIVLSEEQDGYVRVRFETSKSQITVRIEDLEIEQSIDASNSKRDS